MNLQCEYCKGSFPSFMIEDFTVQYNIENRVLPLHLKVCRGCEAILKNYVFASGMIIGVN